MNRLKEACVVKAEMFQDLKDPSQPPPYWFDAIETIDITRRNEILLLYGQLCS